MNNAEAIAVLRNIGASAEEMTKAIKRMMDAMPTVDQAIRSAKLSLQAEGAWERRWAADREAWNEWLEELLEQAQVCPVCGSTSWSKEYVWMGEDEMAVSVCDTCSWPPSAVATVEEHRARYVDWLWNAIFVKQVDIS